MLEGRTSFEAMLQRCVGRFGWRRVGSQQSPAAEEPWSSWEDQARLAEWGCAGRMCIRAK